MKKMFLVIILLLVTANVAHADYKFADKWSWKDTGIEGVFMATLALDWASTRSMASKNWIEDGKQYQETCPFLPKRPTTDDVDKYFLVAAGGHALIALALPPKATIFGCEINPRLIWQCVWIGIEIEANVYNYSAGVRIGW
jgi:hypothetical protein